jgi:hypothetical protein
VSRRGGRAAGQGCGWRLCAFPRLAALLPQAGGLGRVCGTRDGIVVSCRCCRVCGMMRLPILLRSRSVGSSWCCNVRDAVRDGSRGGGPGSRATLLVVAVVAWHAQADAVVVLRSMRSCAGTPPVVFGG